jgi:hypothetical protein
LAAFARLRLKFVALRRISSSSLKKTSRGQHYKTFYRFNLQMVGIS